MRKYMKYLIGVLVLFILVGCNYNSSILVRTKNLERISFLALNNEDIIFSKDGKSYLIRDNKEQTLKFNIVGKFTKAGERFFYIKDGEKYGIVDSNLKIIQYPRYLSIVSIDFSNEFIGLKDNGKYVFFTPMKGESEGEFEGISIFNEEKKFRVKKDGKYGVLDDRKKWILPTLFDYIYTIKDNRILVDKNGKCGLYSVDATEILAPIYDGIFFTKENYLAKKDGVYYLNGENIGEYNIYPSLNSVLVYEKGDGFSLIDLEKKVFYDKVFLEVSMSFKDYLIVGDGEKYAVLDKKDIEKNVNYTFDYIENLSINNFVGGEAEKGLLALIADGKVVTPNKYEQIIEINDDNFFGIVRNEIEWINGKGKILGNFLKGDVLYFDKEVILKRVDEGFEIIQLKG